MTLDRHCSCVPDMWPPDCEALVPMRSHLGSTPVLLVVPEQWCAREFTIGERVRVGDSHGYRSIATVMDRPVHPDIPGMKGFAFLVEHIEEEWPRQDETAGPGH